MPPLEAYSLEVETLPKAVRTTSRELCGEPSDAYQGLQERVHRSLTGARANCTFLCKSWLRSFSKSGLDLHLDQHEHEVARCSEVLAKMGAGCGAAACDLEQGAKQGGTDKYSRIFDRLQIPPNMASLFARQFCVPLHKPINSRSNSPALIAECEDEQGKLPDFLTKTGEDEPTLQDTLAEIDGRPKLGVILECRCINNLASHHVHVLSNDRGGIANGFLAIDPNRRA